MGMEKYVIGVCDDDPADMARICKELVRCMILLGEKEPLLYTCQSGKEMFEECRNRKMRLVLLDLEMPGWGGFDLAGELYAMDPEIRLIFVSNHENMVFDSYEYAPLWFVRKSAMERDMMKAVQRYCQIADKVQLHCKSREGMRDVWVCVNEVLYIECSGHTLLMKMTNQECYQLYGSLKALEANFSSHGFVRVHKNYLVNAKYVKEVGNRSIRLQNGVELDIGKNRRKEILEMVESVRKGRGLC